MINLNGLLLRNIKIKNMRKFNCLISFKLISALMAKIKGGSTWEWKCGCIQT